MHLTEQLVSLGFDKAAVLRNLANAGLIFRTELGDQVWRFEALDPRKSGAENHPHFICVECASVTCEVDDTEFTTTSKRRATTIGRTIEILVKGPFSPPARPPPPLTDGR